MSKKTLSITEQIERLERENKRLKSLEKVADKAVEIRLGMSVPIIRKELENSSGPNTFAQEICDFFNLRSMEDKDNFLKKICTYETRHFLEDINYENKTYQDEEG